MLEEERVKKGRERVRKTVRKGKHGVKCQTQIEYNKVIDTEGIISNVPLIHEACLFLVLAYKTNKLSTLKVSFRTCVNREDLLTKSCGPDFKLAG